MLILFLKKYQASRLQFKQGAAYTRDGGITVFMALSLTIILSLMLSTVESARIHAIMSFEKESAQLALESVLAEYNIPLYERYGLFAVDGNRDYLTEDILKYAERNETQGIFAFEASQAYIAETVLLSDMDYMPMEKEIVQYMKVKKGEDLISSLSNQNNQTELSKIQSSKKDLNKKIDEYAEAAQLESEQNNGEIITDNEADNAESVKDPRKSLMDILKEGILKLILPEGTAVSQKSLKETVNQTKEEKICHGISDFNQTQQVTNFLQSMDFSQNMVQAATDQLNGLIVNEYILEHFKRAAASDEICKSQTTQLQYEIEYIICGHSDDRDNLLDIANRIILIRTALNTAYLMSDAEKVSQVHTLAASLSAIFPFMEPVVYMLIMAAWGYAESIVDVRSLLAGSRVPLMKNRMTWNLSLTALMDGKLNETGQDSEGMDYGDYLRILLFVTKRKIKYERMENLIQANIRLEEGFKDFTMHRCYYALTCYFEFYSETLFGAYTGNQRRYVNNEQWAECY